MARGTEADPRLANVPVTRRDTLAADVCTSNLESSRNLKDFLCTLFRALDLSEVRYCVLHSWDGLPATLVSDLDMAVHPKDAHKLSFVIGHLKQRGYIPVQLLNYFVNAYYFVFFWMEGKAARVAAIDFILEHRRGGLIVPSGEQLVSGRKKEGLFWIPGADSEFTYLLAKKAWKAALPSKQARRLKVLVEQLGLSRAQNLASQLFIGTLANRVVEACASGRLDKIIGQIGTETRKTALVKRPLQVIPYVLSDAVRRVRRCLQPTGLFIVVLGPDGAGKSSVIERLIETNDPAFRRRKVFHWRPMLMGRKNSADDANQPHSKPQHTAWWSVLRLLFHVADYWLGYCLSIRLQLIRSGLVVFDRYFYDLLVDPKRYCFGGPLWVARLLSRMIPKPDLLFLLDAPVEVILSRKREVHPDELLALRHKYLELVKTFSEGRVIDSAQPLAQVVEAVRQAVHDCLAQRFELRHANWLNRQIHQSRP